jgi:alpha-mannosidase
MSTAAADARRQLEGATIWLWHYLHADWQWEQSRAWHEERYALAVCEVLDLMRQDPEITYFFDTASEFYLPVAERLGPRLEELKERVREGRIRVVSAQVANARPNQVGDETYVRNLQRGRSFFEAALPPTDLSLFHSVDIAIGHAQMPQVLRLAGFTAYRAGRPHGPLNALRIPHQFHWEGLDGTRILVTRGPYGGLYLPEHVPWGYRDDWDGAVGVLFDHMFRDQLLQDRSPSRQLWMIQGGDDTRPLRAWQSDLPFDLLAFVAEWRRRETVPLRWGTPLEFSQAVAASGEDLRVVPGVLDGCDCGYNVANGGANGLWHWRQANDRRLLRAEWWAAAATLAGAAAPEAELRRLWWQHLTYQAHAAEFAFREDLAQLLDRAQEVRLGAEAIERHALAAITAAAGGGDRTTYYLFNPHPWPVETDVDLAHPCATTGVQALTVVDETGNPLPSQTMAEFRHPRYGGSLNEGRLLVRAALPPLGHRRVRVVEQAQPPAAGAAAGERDVLETASLRLVARDGAIREVHDRASGAVYSWPDGAPWPLPLLHVLEHQNWLFEGEETARLPFVVERGGWREIGPLRWCYRSEGRVGPFACTLDLYVPDHGRRIEIVVQLDGQWAGEPPSTGFVTLLACVGTGGQITVDVPFGVEARDPDHDVSVANLPRGVDLGDMEMGERPRPGFFWGRSWADWSAAGHGVALLSADGCCYWYKGSDHLGHILLRCIERPAGTWEAYAADALSGAGSHTFRYALHLHDGTWRGADLQRRAQELRHPARAVRAIGRSAPILGTSLSLLRLDGPALLSACYAEGDELVVRLYEHTGMGGWATLTLPWSSPAARAVDFLDQPVEAEVTLAGSEVRVALRPWQIATLRIDRLGAAYGA